MAVKTLTLASIYELQGLKDEALEIYQEILIKDPANIEAKESVRRLKGERKKFAGANRQMVEFFGNMQSAAEFREFERWLIWT